MGEGTAVIYSGNVTNTLASDTPRTAAVMQIHTAVIGFKSDAL
jgi:hypothetical protein